MTDENKPGLVEGEGIVPSNSDYLLTLLVQMVNASSMEIGITLFVQGSIVTGLLIRGETYFEGFKSEIALSSASDNIKEVFQTIFDRLQSICTNLPENEEQESQFRNVEFIHLKNAKFFAGGSLIPTNRAVYWRGRLSSIDGFSLGNLS
jgi:ABC-type bacteriocin/lantibiotic exporter with double-glycine peptidase domain